MRRASSALRFAVVAQSPMKQADIATVVNHEAYVNKTGVQQTNLLKIVRDLAIRYQLTQKHLNFISKHHAGIYTRLADIVFDKMQGRVLLLEDVPNLRDIVCDRIKNEYRNLFDVAAKRTAQDAGKVLSALGLTLDLGTFTSMIRALACCPLPEELVPDARVETMEGPPESWDQLSEVLGIGLGQMTDCQRRLISMVRWFGKKVTNTTGEAKVAAAEDAGAKGVSALTTAGRGEQDDPMKLILAHLPGVNALGAAFDFAEMKSLRTINIEISDLKRYLEPINKLAHSVAKLNNCLVIHVITILLKRNIRTVSQHVNARLPTNLQNKVIAPIFSSKAKANAVISGANADRRKRIEATLNSLDNMLTAAGAMNKACQTLGTDHTIRTATATKMKSKLQNWLEEMGRAAKECGDDVDLEAETDSSGSDTESDDEDSERSYFRSGWPQDLEISRTEMQQLLCEKQRRVEGLKERPKQLLKDNYDLRFKLKQTQMENKILQQELADARDQRSKTTVLLQEKIEALEKELEVAKNEASDKPADQPPDATS